MAKRRYSVSVRKATPEMFPEPGQKYVVFLRDEKNPLNSGWRFYKTKKQADQVARDLRAQI